MTKLETEFLEEYKKTDNMIKDAYSCTNGVSEYISIMEKVPGSRAVQVPSWYQDYKMLKHLRWLRNRIAHDTEAPDLTQDDLDDIKDFRKRFLKAQDPLAAAERLKKTAGTARGAGSGKTHSSAGSAGKAAAASRGTSGKAAGTGNRSSGRSSGLSKKPFPWARVIIGALIAAILYTIIRNSGSLF